MCSSFATLHRRNKRIHYQAYRDRITNFSGFFVVIVHATALDTKQLFQLIIYVFVVVA